MLRVAGAAPRRVPPRHTDELVRFVNDVGRKHIGSGLCTCCAHPREALSLEAFPNSPYNESERGRHSKSAHDCTSVRALDGSVDCRRLLSAPFISNSRDSWLRRCRWSVALRSGSRHFRSRRRELGVCPLSGGSMVARSVAIWLSNTPDPMTWVPSDFTRVRSFASEV